MSDVRALGAEVKERAGKGAARAARREGRVPAVIYGGKKNPVMITLDPKEVLKELHAGQFFNSIYEIKVKGGSERVLPRDLQTHPVNDRPMHADFLRVSASTEVAVNVPVSFINEDGSPGLKMGGVLNVVRYEIEFSCRADAIPETIEVDLTGYEVGDSIHISQIALPDGVTPTITDRDFTVATIAAPSALKGESEDGEEGEAEAGAEAPAEEAGEGEAQSED